MSAKGKIGILVGGGPAPGINGVISAATIEASNRGYQVIGIKNGYEDIRKANESCLEELKISDVSRIHLEGGSILDTSRASLVEDKNGPKIAAEFLLSKGINYLITIGGDGTVSGAKAISEASKNKLVVGHVPKTIDNDIPLPGQFSTFGYHSAREEGARILETLMLDAKTIRRWYIVVAMGRKAGHLALGIGNSAGATLTLVPEEFRDKVSFSEVVWQILGSILKRLAMGKKYGVCVVAEGVAEKIDPETIDGLEAVERDAFGRIRHSAFDFSRLLSEAVSRELKKLEIDLRVLRKDLGYELRCCPPNAFDKEYTRYLGYGVVDHLLKENKSGMVYKEGDKLKLLSFSDLFEDKKNQAKIRYLDISSDAYKIARNYMIRIEKEDLEDKSLMRDLKQFLKNSPFLV